MCGYGEVIKQFKKSFNKINEMKLKTLMKPIFLITFAFLFYLNAFCQDSKIEKIEALIDLMNTEQRMSDMINNLVNESLKAADSSDSVFWNEYKARVGNVVTDFLKPQIISIYDKYFSGEEINYIYDFYSSDLGKQTLVKYDKLLQELMLIGMSFGKRISNQIIEDIQEQEKKEIDFKMNNVFTGCSRFKTGKYKQLINDTLALHYERDDKRQIEMFGQGRAVYDIDWLNDCRYTLILVETNNPYDQNYIGAKTIVNIYETGDNSYKFYYKLESREDIYEGEIMKIE
jgi:uncharacterized protein